MQTWLAAIALLTLATSPVIASEEPRAEEPAMPEMREYEVPPPPPATQTFEDLNIRQGDTLSVGDTELVQGAIDTQPIDESH